MAVQDTTIQANVNNYFFKTRADYEAHASEILNNSTIYIESDGEYGNLKMNLLWENLSPSSDFAAQSIEIANLMTYDYLIITSKMFKNGTGVFQYQNTSIMNVAIGAGCTLRSNLYDTNPRDRNVLIETGNNIYFSDAIFEDGTAVYNNYCIPLQIYGLKIVPVSDSSGGGSQVSIVDWSLEVSE